MDIINFPGEVNFVCSVLRNVLFDIHMCTRLFDEISLNCCIYSMYGYVLIDYPVFNNAQQRIHVSSRQIARFLTSSDSIQRVMSKASVISNNCSCNLFVCAIIPTFHCQLQRYSTIGLLFYPGAKNTNNLSMGFFLVSTMFQGLAIPTNAVVR